MSWTDDIHLPYAKVVGKFGAVIEDRIDGDLFPDIIPSKGTVTLTPSVKMAIIDGALMTVNPVEAKVINGLIVSEDGSEGIYILATDGIDSVTNWGWTATFSIGGMTITSKSFYAPRNSTIDLADILTPVSGGIIETVVGPVGPVGPRGQSITGFRQISYGLVVAVFEDGTESDPISLPPGPVGASLVGGETQPDGTVVLLLSDGTRTDPVTFPTGPKGDKGDHGGIIRPDPDRPGLYIMEGVPLFTDEEGLYRLTFTETTP